jgi:hypothetical protein
VLERLVEHWLTSVGELGYQDAFAQLLLAEGHTVLQGPVHHGFEHGKDILTLSPRRKLHAYQLKGPKEISDLKGLEQYQGQLEAMASTAVPHPALSKPRLADRVHVVTNGVLRPEVRDRLHYFSLGLKARHLPPLEYIERDHLVSRFIAANGRYLPREPKSFRTLVDLFSNDGRGPLPISQLLAFIEESLPFDGQPKPLELQRAAASAAILTAYALRGWEAAQNHLPIAQGWLAYCCALLRLAETHRLEDAFWRPSYSLAFAAARGALIALLAEAAERDDLIEPDIAESAFYGTRAMLVCGYSAALFVSDSLLGQSAAIRARVRDLLRREFRYCMVTGEAAAPLMFAIANAVSLLEGASVGEHIVNKYLRFVLQSNQGGSSVALPDPYHAVDEALAMRLDISEQGEDESFDGRSYSARAAMEWMARRLRRQAVRSHWYAYTGLVTCEFVVSAPDRLLTASNDEGRLEMIAPKQPGSWKELRREALSIDPARFPSTLWRCSELLPYLPLLLPHRFTSELTRAIDFFCFPTADFLVAAPRAADVTEATAEAQPTRSAETKNRSARAAKRARAAKKAVGRSRKNRQTRDGDEGTAGKS